jgi:hypothetical protein
MHPKPTASYARHSLVFVTGVALLFLGTVLPIPRAGADPIGMSVSGGVNPIVSITGMTTGNALATIYTVPTGKLFVITDIHVAGGGGTSDMFKLWDATQNKWVWAGYWDHDTTQAFPGETESAQQQLTTGIALPAGTVLQAQAPNSQQNFYTITGYLARP